MAKQKRRIETEQRIVDATWALVEAKGLDGVGVNAVAAAAGVDKVLVYRYFGGLEGLLERCGEDTDFWPTTDALFGGEHRPLLTLPLSEMARAVSRNYVSALWARPATLQVLRSECVERNPLTAALETVREVRSLELLQVLEARGFIHTDAQRVLFAGFGASVNYLLIRGPELATFSGMPLSEGGLDALCDATVAGILALGGASGPPDA